MRMKKWTALILTVLLCLSLAACKDKAVQEVESAISAVGEVTLNSRETIDAARTAYNGLTDEQKKTVENLEKLTEAEDTYEALVLVESVAFGERIMSKLQEIINATNARDWETGLDLVQWIRTEIEEANPDVYNAFTESVHDTSLPERLDSYEKFFKGKM